jgi:hypothetical protein
MTSLLWTFYRFLFREPLLRLYRSGPSLRGIGFWGGMTDSEICALATSHAQTFWEVNNSECSKIVQRKEESFVVFTESAIQIYAVYIVTNFVIWNCYLYKYRQVCGAGRGNRSRLRAIPYKES